MRYLITGHTGFKGSWLTAMLKIQGHEVIGISLPPESKSNFLQSNISEFLNQNYYVHIEDFEEINKIIQNVEPEIIIHGAAQPLVLPSYSDPIGTFQTNLIGTLNILKSANELSSLKACLVITTDKVYKNINSLVGYKEGATLGGKDPYSASKACADIACQAWRTSFDFPNLDIARAGNVIGGGDWSNFRLVPDLIKAYESGTPLRVRNLDSVRPWQFVLDCLAGYQKLINFRLQNEGGEEWNFGPRDNEFHSVRYLIDNFTTKWGAPLTIDQEEISLPEASLLVLDSSKSRDLLGWNEKLNFEETLDWTIEWYKSSNKPLTTITQIEKFLNL